MSNGESAPDTQDGNPFSLIAYVLFRARHALEDREEENRPPRWVRIARSSRHKQVLPLGPLVSASVDGMAETLSHMVELTLDLEELLEQTDGASAVGEVMLRLVQAASDETFRAGIEALLGTSSLGELDGAMETIQNAASGVEPYLDYIPAPEDVSGLGHELYRLLCIVQKPFPRTPTGTIDTTTPAAMTDLHGREQLVWDHCGKVRLCAWAYQHDVKTHGLGPDEASSVPLSALGLRRLYPTAMGQFLPGQSEVVWSDGEANVRILHVDLSGEMAGKDIFELVRLLQSHGYDSPAMDVNAPDLNQSISSNLLQFQAINELPLTGELDNETLNRLVHLDYVRKNLRRARPYDPTFPFPQDVFEARPKPLAGEISLVNAGADAWQDEGLALVSRTPHPYVLVPATPAAVSPPSAEDWPQQRGWLSDEQNGAVPGFVALRSRARNRDESVPGRFIGGIWSEGEAAYGQFFWAARHVEPWRDGRSGAPGPDALFGGTQPAAGSISRMYQWIPLPVWLDPSNPANNPDGLPGWTLYVYAGALQRSLFTDRGASGYPDQGRIILELYGNDYTSPADARQPSLALGSVATPWFPDNAATTAALTLAEVDRKRLWTLRRTALLEIPASVNARALCIVAEGMHRSAHDTDAYFDDFRVGYLWRRPAAP